MKSLLHSKTKFPVLMLGWILLMIGVLGLLLPLLPGIPLLIAGLVILSREYDWARRLLVRGRRSLPGVSAKFRQIWRRVRMAPSQRSPNPTDGPASYRSAENQ
jgi:uncharacterized membrane protein YbaN (DUF454 family)